MKKPLLIELAYTSILEVFQTQKLIDTVQLQKAYPLLNESIVMTLKIFLDGELRGYYEDIARKPLLQNIILGAKKAAFEDKNFTPLTLSEYFDIEIEISLQTPEGVISHRA
jgi:AMMECR1 domain-containing protein